MKTGKTLQELAAEIDRQAKAKRDFVAGSHSMFMADEGSSFHLTNTKDGHPVSSEFKMTALFHRQLGASLGIPAKYYDKMWEDYPDLLMQNVNGWLGKEHSKHTIRTLDGTARAFLSDRYRRIDNADIMRSVLPVIGEMKGAFVESCEVTESRMYIKVVNTRLEMEVRKGDIVQAGIVISNSEVGLGSVQVMPLVYRLVCLNGMVVNDMGKRKYHIGRENEETWELFCDETLQADDKAFMLKLKDIVRSALDEAKFSMVVNKLRDATEARITARVPDVVELTSKQYGFTGSEESDILKYLIEGGDLSLYGLSNAVTRTSQDVLDYDRATVLESAGWEIAAMSRDIWKSLNAGVLT
jgi:hypothetical protein